MDKKKILSKLSKKTKVWAEKVSFVVIQEPDYNGGHRISFFGYTKKLAESAMEIADSYVEQPFTYILNYTAQEGEWYEEHREPFHEEAYDTPVLIREQDAMFILK